MADTWYAIIHTAALSLLSCVQSLLKAYAVPHSQELWLLCKCEGSLSFSMQLATTTAHLSAVIFQLPHVLPTQLLPSHLTRPVRLTALSMAGVYGDHSCWARCG